MPIELVMNFLGHESIDTTLKYSDDRRRGIKAVTSEICKLRIGKKYTTRRGDHVKRYEGRPYHVVMFVSRNKDNSKLQNFKQRTKAF